jgi:hypothetical protein
MWYSWYEWFVTLSHLILAFFLVFGFLSVLRFAQTNFRVRAEYYQQISALSEPRKARKLQLGVFMQFTNVILFGNKRCISLNDRFA